MDHWFAYGFKSEAAALEGMEKAFSTGEILPGEHPRIERYPVHQGSKFRKWCYGIKVTL